MKTTYITPATETVNVATQHMIAASTGSGIEFGTTGSGRGSFNSDYENGVLSRDVDLW